MTMPLIAAIVFACTFFGGMLGIRTREALPSHHLSNESKDLVRLCMGLIGTLTALILGLVTASAKEFYDEEAAALHRVAADLLMLDRTLAAFGPEVQGIRGEVREAVRMRVDRAWATERSPAEREERASDEAPSERIVRHILSLSPRNDAERWFQAQALDIASDVLKTRWMSLTEASNVSPHFMTAIVFWLSVLFWSFGLFAPRNATVTAVLLLASLSVAASVLLILEMQTPFSGLLRISSDPLRLALEQMGR